MGNEPTGIRICKPGLDLLDDVQVIDDILKAAVIGQPIEKILHPLLRGLHAPRIAYRWHVFARPLPMRPKRPGHAQQYQPRPQQCHTRDVLAKHKPAQERRDHRVDVAVGEDQARGQKVQCFQERSE